MTVLGIDCSTKWTNMGLAIDGRIAGEVNMSVGRRQSLILPAMLGQLLFNAGADLHSVDALCITSGPGYFTGIRVGLAYGCALAEGLDKRVVIIDSLTALAAPHLNGARSVVPVIRARSGFVFSAMINGTIFDPFYQEIPGLFPVAGFLDIFRADKPVLFVLDDDTSLFEDFPFTERPDMTVSSIRGGQVALLGLYGISRSVSPAMVRGRYMRDPDIGKRKYTE